MTEAQTFNLRPHQLVALLVIFMSVFSAPLTTAYNIGAITTAFDATGAEAGFVITVEGICVSLAAILCSRLITKFYIRTFLLVGIVMCAAGNALTLLAPTIDIMTLCRMLSGFGTGAVVCVIMAAAARTPNPEMTYGWINGAVGAFISILALSVPFAISRGGLDAAYGLYTVLALIGICLILVVPNSKAPEHEPVPLENSVQSSEPKLLAYAGWIALIGTGIFFLSQAGVIAFVAKIGLDIEISLSAIGFAFFVSGLLTIIGPVLAGVIGSRFGSTLPLLIVGVLMCLSIIAIAISGSQIGFYIGIPLLVVLPTMMLPSFLGGLALIDPSGRLAGTQPAFATMGAALGAVIGGAIVDAAGFNGLGWFMIAVLIVGTFLMVAGTLKADNLRVAKA